MAERLGPRHQVDFARLRRVGDKSISGARYGSGFRSADLSTKGQGVTAVVTWGQPSPWTRRASASIREDEAPVCGECCANSRDRPEGRSVGSRRTHT